MTQQPFGFLYSLVDFLYLMSFISTLIYLNIMQGRKVGKRGRPSKKGQQSEEQQSESFSHKPLKKKPTKKLADQKKKDQLIVRKSKSKVELSSVQSFSDSQEQSRKSFKVPVQVFNSGQVFADILNKANRQPQFLIMLKNLLSGCARLRQDKKSLYRKKWKMLRNSNCTQSQYLSRQNELKRMETQQIGEIEDDIISKLSLANIRGFETRQSITNNFKLSQQNIDDNIQFMIDEAQWQKYREQQKKLLQILMNENDFVSQDFKLINVTTKYVPESQNPNAIYKEEQNEMEVKFNNLQTQQNQQSIQFHFCKNYNNINYEKIFDTSFPFKISEDQKYMIDSKAMSWLLQSKCDEIYTNQQFQKQTYQKYSGLLVQMYKHPENFSDTEIMNHVLEAGAYILNSVHYYQKFKLKCQLLHPLDLLLITEKITKQRNKHLKTEYEMEIEGLAENSINRLGSEMIDEKQEKYDKFDRDY